MKYTIETLNNLLFTNFLIVGKWKSGKTFSCATAHKLKSRPWVTGRRFTIFDFDEGCQPIVRQAMKQGWAKELDVRRYNRIGGNKIDLDKSEPTRSKDILLDYLTDINAFYDMCEPLPTGGYKWKDSCLDDAPYCILTDSLTKLADDTLSFTLGAKELGGDNVHGGAEYKKQQDKIVEVIRAIRELPCFSIFTAHETLREEQVKMPSPPRGSHKPIDPVITNNWYRLPLVTGQLAFSIGGEFGVVLYTHTEQETTNKRKFLWKTQATDNIYGAGSRLIDNLAGQIDQDFDLLVEGSTNPTTLFKKSS